MDNTAGAEKANVEQQLSLPAILLMVGAGLGVLGALGGLVLYSESTLKMLIENPDAPENAREQLRSYMGQLGPLRMILGSQLLLSAFAFTGGLMMKLRKSFGLAVAGAIAACLPCLGPCCGITGVPLGIWALVVLFSNPDVKRSFQ